MTISKLFSHIRQCVTGHVPSERRLHDDFDSHDGIRWFANKPMQDVACLYFEERAEKLRVFLKDDDLPRLNGCPFPARLGRAAEPERGYDYCAFLYAIPGDASASDITSWARARGLEKIALLSTTQGAAMTLQNA